jgi:hypothetical protein
VEALEANKVFSQSLDFPHYVPSIWQRATFSSILYDDWWQEWHAHLFCNLVHPFCHALDETFESEGEVHIIDLYTYHKNFLSLTPLSFNRTLNMCLQKLTEKEKLLITIAHAQM